MFQVKFILYLVKDQRCSIIEVVKVNVLNSSLIFYLCLIHRSNSTNNNGKSYKSVNYSVTRSTGPLNESAKSVLQLIPFSDGSGVVRIVFSSTTGRGQWCHCLKGLQKR